jgi:hypothetical protein
MKSYILKSWLTGETVYESDKKFPSEMEMWMDVAVMKHQYFGTYAVVIRG